MSSKDHPLEKVLLAAAPLAALRQELMLFGQFEGAWELDVTWYREGEVVRREQGEWHFGWILAGRAMQDVWIVPPLAAQRSGAEPYEYGTSIRFFDPALGVWRSTWLGPVQGSVRPFEARARGSDIVLQGQQLDGADIQWVFSNIEHSAFSWRFTKRSPDGVTWDIVQAFECRRKA
jgi:hypothetical protein